MLTASFFRFSRFSSPISRRTLLTQAFVHGPAEPPLLESTIGEHFRGVVKEHGDRLACVLSLWRSSVDKSGLILYLV
jgi:hypothetical protein